MPGVNGRTLWVFGRFRYQEHPVNHVTFGKAMKPGIAKKLFLFFFLFILIFYGTVFDLLFKVREMSARSERIVGVNNRVAALSRTMQDTLLDLETNARKLRLLKKELYFDGFEKAVAAYGEALSSILILDDSPLWRELDSRYGPYIRPVPSKAALASKKGWAGTDQVPGWAADIDAARRANRALTERALIRINTLSGRIVHNGFIGFGISILVGLFGILFISRSMLVPLNRLKTGLAHVSNDNFSHQIPVRSTDEFGELTRAFNNMSRQLRADEEIRTEFIATLSHEIRTPLASVREAVNMVSEGILGPVTRRQQKFLSIAGKETARIAGLLNRLLDAAGRESVPGNPEALDPNTLVREAVQRLAGQAETAGVRVGFTPLPSAPPVLANPEEILQVLINLLENAIKFSGEADRIDLFLTQEARYLLFNISDSGPGIPPGQESLVFKKYYRTREVRDHADGVGLGLSIAKRIVRAHGGEIFVVNNDNRGCTFSFSLPLAKTA